MSCFGDVFVTLWIVIVVYNVYAFFRWLTDDDVSRWVELLSDKEDWEYPDEGDDVREEIE